MLNSSRMPFIFSSPPSCALHVDRVSDFPRNVAERWHKMTSLLAGEARRASQRPKKPVRTQALRSGRIPTSYIAAAPGASDVFFFIPLYNHSRKMTSQVSGDLPDVVHPRVRLLHCPGREECRPRSGPGHVGDSDVLMSRCP